MRGARPFLFGRRTLAAIKPQVATVLPVKYTTDHQTIRKETPSSQAGQPGANIGARISTDKLSRTQQSGLSTALDVRSRKDPGDSGRKKIKQRSRENLCQQLLQSMRVKFCSTTGGYLRLGGAQRLDRVRRRVS